MTLFDSIGKTYNATRQADARIVAGLVELLDLNLGSTVADIGAGTGNYSAALADAGFIVKAVEPSRVMRSHARKHPGPSIEWIEGSAEDIPLPDASVDGVISILAVPHFSDPDRAFREMARISSGGPIVVFTFDGEVGKTTWMYDYFPCIWDTFDHLPRFSATAAMLSRATLSEARVVPFLLPPDLEDNFGAAAWRQPYLYLNEDYRANISSFQAANPNALAGGVKRLAADLESGHWLELYGEVLELEELDAGYRYLYAREK